MMPGLARVLTVALATLLPFAAAADPVRLKFAFFAPDTELTWVTTIRPFIDAVNAEASGVIRIDGYPNGALSRNLPQQPQIVLDGVADFAFAIPGITPGRFADNGLIELPGIFHNIRDSTIAYTHLARAGRLRGYEQYYVVGAFGAVPASVHTRPAITDLASLKGLKIRATNATEQKVLRALGAASILLPTSDAAEAIARGTIDGTAMQPVPLVDFGISRLTNYHYFPTFGVAPLVVLMNRAKFDSLPPAGQAAIAKYSGDWIARLYYTRIGAESDRIVKAWQADPKQKLIQPTAAERARLAAVYQKIDDDWAAESPHNAELLAALKAEMRSIDADP